MSDDESKRLQELTRIFRELGASDPESYARSEISEGIPQLATYLFLKQAWFDVIAEDDDRWMNNAISSSQTHPDAPHSGAGLAIRRMLAKGVDPKDIIDLARSMQVQTLFCMAYLVGDADSGRVSLPEGCPDVRWGLFEINEDGDPIRPMGCLHEGVLSHDPTGREMRPRPRPESD